MSYVLVGILFLLIATGFITFLVMNASKRSSHATATDDDSGAPGIGTDDAPLADTTEHAGHQPQGEGVTVGEQDADEVGGTGAATRGEESITGDDDQGRPAGRFQRDPVGGEAEARPYTD